MEHSRQRLTWTTLAIASVVVASGCAAPPPVSRSVIPPETTMATRTRSDGATRFQVTNTTNASRWAKIERLTSTVAGFPVEKARPNGRQTDSEIVTAFGTDTPPSRDVLLHYFKGWDSNKGRAVILVHGAIHEATSSWISPHDNPGLAPYLAAKGFRVFAVTFAHRHGDNMLQAEQLANAIARVRTITGADTVDLVAHSKGCVVARALLSGVTAPGMGGYQGDVRRVLFLGGPHKGTDYTFRHPSVNYGLYPEQDTPLRDAPMCWTSMLYLGQWVDTASQTMLKDHGDYFPGQSQLFARWDKVFPLSQTEPDWYTTYNGGQGFVSQSPGIDKVIAAGGNFMDRLAKHPLDQRLQFAVLAGDSPDLPGILNEMDGPSDGVVFVQSATATSDLARGGANLVAKQVLHLNHMALIFDPAAKAWVANHLSN